MLVKIRKCVYNKVIKNVSFKNILKETKRRYGKGRNNGGMLRLNSETKAK